MPYVDLTVSNGDKFSFHYSISTPTSKSAETITPNLPCILFLHSGYVAKELFELQFSDRRLRQFNLIAIEMRGYGDTKGMIGDTVFTPTESALDVDQIMTKLNLPPCHFFGLSNGCTVALELAVYHPDRILSLTLCSPLPPVEPAEIAEGRMEIYRYWNQLEELIEAGERDSALCEHVLEEVVTGATQLLYNQSKSSYLEAICKYGLAIAMRNWSGSQDKLKESYKTAIEWFLNRKPIPESLYKNIKAPVSIIHCFEDILYPFECAEALADALEGAGVSRVSLHEVPGAHYGNATHPEQVNKILYETVVSCQPGFPQYGDFSDEDDVERLPTPFTDSLIQYGYDPSDESD